LSVRPRRRSSENGIARLPATANLAADSPTAYKPPTQNNQDKPMRPSKRAADEMRKVTLERGVVRYAEGSCMVSFGETRVLCAATVEEKGPSWLRGTGKGWVTAEYAMLPRATHERNRR